MAKVQLRPEIASISGKIGKVLFKTFKDGTVRMYKAPEYKRRNAPSKAEIKAHELFSRRTQRVTELVAQGVTRQEAWSIARSEIQ